MNPSLIIVAILSFILVTSVQAQEMDTELSDLANKLATLTKENDKKKVTVLDFTDLQGVGSELGRYVAEELTVNLVIAKKTNFAVLDRANLKKILAEHKLTATGLIDPENAKKLGQFAGVDALILGTIVSRGSKVSVTAKIITTDTAEIVGAAKAEFKMDEDVRELSTKTNTNTSSESVELKDDAPKVMKVFGDLRVELLSLRVVNGREYLLTAGFVNQSKKSLWLALKRFPNGLMPSKIIDPDQREFETTSSHVSGIETSEDYQNNFDQATEIKAGDSLTAMINFYSPGKTPSAGVCRLQLAILSGPNFHDHVGATTPYNLVTKIEAK